MASRNRPLNVQIRVASQGGWLAIFRGESQGSALERVLPELERDGYRVAFIVPDSFSLGKKLLNFFACVSDPRIFLRSPRPAHHRRAD